MKTVSQILHAKGAADVHAISPDETVLEAIRHMAEKGIGALVVRDGESIVGMVTERDYARKVILMGRNSDQTAVREIMTPTVLYVRPQQSNEDCMALMANSRVRHLPVLEGGLRVFFQSALMLSPVWQPQLFTNAPLAKMCRSIFERSVSCNHALAELSITLL